MSEAAQLELIRSIPGILAAVAAIISVILVNRVRTNVTTVNDKVDTVHNTVEKIQTQTDGLTTTAIATAVQAERLKGEEKVEIERTRGEDKAAVLVEQQRQIGEKPNGGSGPKSTDSP